MTNNQHKPYGVYERFFKRGLDCFLSGIAMIILSPVFCIVALLVRLDLGKPVLFQQERPGLNGKIFKIHKFRSMLPPQTLDGKNISDEERVRLQEKGVEVLSDEARLTRFGRILRTTSLDELPELWNIFVGEMSFVGPRPLATVYLPYYNEYEKHRHDVRPGLTGAAQVHGRNAASWEERFKFDVEYVHKITFLGDLKIIAKTIEVVIKHNNIGQGADIPVSFNVVRQAEWEAAKEKQ